MKPRETERVFLSVVKTNKTFVGAVVCSLRNNDLLECDGDDDDDDDDFKGNYIHVDTSYVYDLDVYIYYIII